MTDVPALPTGQEFYDRLMEQIEPELTSKMLPLLEARYAGETPEQKDVRQARYDAAFAAFDLRAAEEMTKLEQDVHVFRSASLKEMEQASLAEDTSAITLLESSILAA